MKTTYLETERELLLARFKMSRAFLATENGEPENFLLLFVHLVIQDNRRKTNSSTFF
jgi:hypothetical protein